MNDKEFKADIHYRTAAEWATLNTHLSKNDLFIETDTGKMKIGTGLKWADTDYLPGASSGPSVVSLTYASTVTTDASAGDIFDLTLTGNVTLADPTNPVDGKTLTWRILQDDTGGWTVTLGYGFAPPLGAVTPLAFRTGAYELTVFSATYSSARGMWDLVVVPLSGSSNTAAGANATVAGGWLNTASIYGSTVGGGESNTASGGYATVSGGIFSEASGAVATVSGGNNNTASGSVSTVGGGSSNAASGAYSTVSGGSSNTASGGGSTVSGGSQNVASGNASCAGGVAAVADRYGMYAYASGAFSTAGDAQRVGCVLRRVTTNATPTELFLFYDENSGVTERLWIPSGKALFATVTVAGIINGGSKAAHYVRKVAIKNVGGTTALIGTISTVGTDVEDDAAYNVAITADNTNDALIITVTGKAAETIRWVAHVEGVEIAYG